ncbi:MAG: hypothetical protein AMQ22_00068 [Candidatus Methanofastidiosum methylothiophilum]|uniref:Uncharacterized protein n=1 Tax=Candidatus Methanofastidiosum methylothiophilum TaxID=1705564 RepID=A0A150J9F4_9EURY|nr:MAG: hypothetical protein AMQ22_00068 [Candidatus Methanofastidiosum methylthiophilus]
MVEFYTDPADFFKEKLSREDAKKKLRDMSKKNNDFLMRAIQAEKKD